MTLYLPQREVLTYNPPTVATSLHSTTRENNPTRNPYVSVVMT